MDMSMDIDPVNTNKLSTTIQDYLKCKIQEVKLVSELEAKSARQIDEHRIQCMKNLTELEIVNNSVLHVQNIWQRVYNGYWIIGVHVENQMQRSTKNINVILQNEPTLKSLEYSTKMFSKYKIKSIEEIEMIYNETDNENFKSILNEIGDPQNRSSTVPVKNEWIQIETLQDHTTIVILIDLPVFNEMKSINLHGFISGESKSKKVQLPFPIVSLHVEDLLNERYSIKLSDVLHGKEEAYLSIIASGMVTPVKFILPDGLGRSLEGMLQIDCSYNKMNVKGRELMLVFDGDGDLLKHTIIMIRGEEGKVKLITKNENQLHFLYHHLYQKIPRVVILNEENDCIKDCNPYTQNIVGNRQPNQEILKEFVESLNRQMSLLEEKLIYCYQKDGSEGETINLKHLDNYQDVRKQLAGLENETDQLYLKVSHNF